MRKHIWILVLLAVIGFELAAPPVATAQPWSAGDTTVVDTYEVKRIRRKRQIYGLVGTGFVVLVGFCFILMNGLDRRAAQRRQQEKLLERQREGLI
jgi:hypothetical protein